MDNYIVVDAGLLPKGVYAELPDDALEFCFDCDTLSIQTVVEGVIKHIDTLPLPTKRAIIARQSVLSKVAPCGFTSSLRRWFEYGVIPFSTKSSLKFTSEMKDLYTSAVYGVSQDGTKVLYIIS